MADKSLRQQLRDALDDGKHDLMWLRVEENGLKRTLGMLERRADKIKNLVELLTNNQNVLPKNKNFSELLQNAQNVLKDAQNVLEFYRTFYRTEENDGKNK